MRKWEKIQKVLWEESMIFELEAFATKESMLKF